jgi:hypothetical protein
MWEGDIMAAGRPLKFKSAEELKRKIDEYFNSCCKEAVDKKGEKVLDGNGNPVMIQYKPFTISGLAYYLDTNRQTLLNYQGRKEFFDTISRAKDKCEAFTEESLFSRDAANGAKFVLLNGYNGWKDKQEFNLSGELGVKVIDNIPEETDD